MLRRLCALILMLTCAFAPVLPAQAVTGEAEDCCCGTSCPCPPTDCAPPPSAPSVPASSSVAALEQRAPAKKPAVRVARAVFAVFLSRPDRFVAPRTHPSTVECATPAASVGLFQAHCSLRL